MRIRRDISSIPYRSASETWRVIIGLVTGQGSQDVRQLGDAAGVIGSIIADQHPARRPILIEGVGPQLRIYCRYGMRAVEEGGAVDGLAWNPTAGDWVMHVPCDPENIGWVEESLAETSPRIKVFDVDEAERAEEDKQKTVNGQTKPVVDWNFGG